MKRYVIPDRAAILRLRAERDRADRDRMRRRRAEARRGRHEPSCEEGPASLPGR